MPDDKDKTKEQLAASLNTPGSRDEINRHMRSLANNISDHIYFKDRDSRFIMVNKAWAARFGLQSPEDAVGKTDFDFFSKEHARQAFEDEKEVIRSGRPLINEEEKETCPDGGATWVSTTKIPLYNEKHKIIGTCGISRDITEQKNLEIQVQKTQKLESLGMLAGGIAHDFNNLLMIISGNLDLAFMDIPPESPSLESIREIKSAIERATSLTEHLMVFSSKKETPLNPVDLTKVAKETIDLLCISAKDNIHLICDFLDDIPLVLGDITQIEQVIMNLIMNALDAIGDKKGTLTIRTCMMRCDRAYFTNAHSIFNLQDGIYVCLEVSDTGCGMDKNTLSKIFDPFFTTKPSGRGLGLPTVFSIVKSHKAAMKVESQPEGGTTFRIVFPPIKQPSAALC